MNARATFARWLEACGAHGGAINELRAPDGTQYYIDAQPRELGNGALVGRAFKFVAGRGMVDVGAWKIARDGRVLQVPAELAPLLEPAATSTPAIAAELEAPSDREVAP